MDTRISYTVTEHFTLQDIYANDSVFWDNKLTIHS